MEFLKTRSKVLLVSTLFSIVVGAIAIFNSLYAIWSAFTPGSEGMIVLSIIFAIPLLALFFGSIVSACGIFIIFTAWRALRTNKKSYHIGNVILSIVIFFLGIPLFVFGSEDVLESIVEYSVYALILRIFGYFNQKKIDKKNIKEEEQK